MACSTSPLDFQSGQFLTLEAILEGLNEKKVQKELKKSWHADCLN
jgi:hypothetical protein